MNRPLPPHGSSARAAGSPGYRPACKCDLCLATARRDRKRRRVNAELGRSAFTEPARAQAHLTELHQYMCWASLHEATGLGVPHLCDLYRGRLNKIHRSTEAKILAVPIPDEVDSTKTIDATGSIRRLRALMYIDHSLRVIGAAADMHHMRIHAIAHGEQATVRRHIADRITHAYRRLALQPPPITRHTARCRNLAMRAGWDGPMAWDDETIDDPAALPDRDENDERMGQQELATVIASEITWLASYGVAEHEIAARVGRTPRYVRSQLTGSRGPGWRKKQSATALAA